MAESRAEQTSKNEAELMERIKALEEENSRLRGEEDEFVSAARSLFERFPGAESFTDDICERISAAEGFTGEGLERALIETLLCKYREPKDLAEDEAFLKEYIFPSPRVRDYIIDNYIEGVKKAPAACVKRAGVLQTEKDKPKTVSAAGELARALFRK